MNQDSIELLARWQAGDEQAAQTLFVRYFARLYGLVRAHLQQRSSARFDADDVVQSAFGSFFRGARDGQFVLQRAGDLWNLLAAIALHKIQHQFERHTAGKRAVQREQLSGMLDEVLQGDLSPLARDPSPQDAAMLIDELEHLLSPLSEIQRQIVEMRLDGFTLDEIAVEVRRSQRTVRRTMEQIKSQMEDRLRGLSQP